MQCLPFRPSAALFICGRSRRRRFAAREGCEDSSRWSETTGTRSIDPEHPERVRVVTLRQCQMLAPLQGANRLTQARRSPLRFDLRLLSDNPSGCISSASLLKSSTSRVRLAKYIIPPRKPSLRAFAESLCALCVENQPLVTLLAKIPTLRILASGGIFLATKARPPVF
jgi:hypothetical protein